MSEKIQKVLANAGVASRRQIETWIREERISINGTKAKIGDRIMDTDKIRVDGREIKLHKSQSEKIRVLLYYKPEGEICSRSDPDNRPTVFDRLPLLRHGRWVAVGRLDFNTSGLLLLTDHGALANKLMHPSTQLEREYAVRVQGELTATMIKDMRQGILLEDGPAHLEHIEDRGGEGRNHWYHVIVKEGRNRIVRRLFESQGLTVSRLIRIRFGNITLPRSLKRGQWMEFSKEEALDLARSVGLRPDSN